MNSKIGLPFILGYAVLILLASAPVSAHAQSRFEFATQFTSLNVGDRTPGFGATLSYGLSRRISIESTLNLFPGNPATNFGLPFGPVLGGWSTGKILQGQFGLTGIVIHRKRAHVFLKAKPGFVSLGNLNYFANTGINGFGNGNVTAVAGRQTSFSFDVGGGAVFSPSPRTFFRFDIGDTYFRYNPFSTTFNIAGVPPALGPVAGFQGTSVHSLQFSMGVGIRFGKTR
ncbi:MAG: hypothetical protein ACR2IF_03625 [Terriglobales bacterium]